MTPFSRRRFLRDGVFLGAGTSLGWNALPRARGATGTGNAGKSPNEKLNIAIIGAGGRGDTNLGSVSPENVVASCGVYEAPVLQAAQKYPQARKYKDFRRWYDRREYRAGWKLG